MKKKRIPRGMRFFLWALDSSDRVDRGGACLLAFARVLRTGGWRHGQREGLRASHHRQLGGFARLEAGDELLEAVDAEDLLAVEALYDVECTKARPACGLLPST